MEKATIESSGVTERLQQLSVNPSDMSVNHRSETPPPQPRFSQGMQHRSSPSLMDISPSHKENSSPTSLVQQKLVRPYDLTPVTRNTGTSYADADDRRLVSPDDHKSGLSLPSSSNFESSARPPLQRRTTAMPCPIPIADRTRSMGHLAELVGGGDDLDDEDDEIHGRVVGEAIQFPSRQQFFSFNSRHHYQQQMFGSANEATSSITPYQPSRQDLSDVGSLSREELSRIFTHRDLNPIPLDERQYSIPSIRMANHLNGSTTTYDDDDEDDLSKDDASWSSRGSSLYLPDDNDASATQVLKFTPNSSKPLVILEDLPFPEILIPSDTGTVGAVNNSDDNINTKNCANRKRKESHEKAYEWLRAVESTGDDLIHEAASSKFLTRGTTLSTTTATTSTPMGISRLRSVAAVECKGSNDSLIVEATSTKFRARGGVKGLIRQTSLPPEVLQPSGRTLVAGLD
ncbi:hypothetical protein MHU86_10455 [Fragilaria crotonensis]|nr:hypothetical protein MHU86_10455 [Fragilaria crotonensis]